MQVFFIRAVLGSVRSFFWQSVGSVRSVQSFFVACPGLLCGEFGLGGVALVGSVSGSVRSVFGARPGVGQPCLSISTRGLSILRIFGD